MMDLDRKTQLAVQLRALGVSQDGIYHLLWQFPEDVIEAQLTYLPYRKAKRPEAFIVEAIRNNYSPPKEFFYAQAQAQPAETHGTVDQDAEHAAGPSAPDPQGHGAESLAGAPAANDGLGQGRPGDHLDLPNFDASHWQKE
jgi:hypothetical protein